MGVSWATTHQLDRRRRGDHAALPVLLDRLPEVVDVPDLTRDRHTLAVDRPAHPEVRERVLGRDKLSCVEEDRRVSLQLQ